MSDSHNNCTFEQLSKAMKFYSLLSTFFCAHFVLFSQSFNSVQTKFTATLDFETNTSEIYEQNGLRIIAQLEKCNNPSIGMEKDYVYFSFQNTNPFDIKFSLEEHLYYDESCKTCGNKEYFKAYYLKANETLTASCEQSSNKSLKIFHGSPWVNEKLSKFELVNIKIEKQ